MRNFITAVAFGLVTGLILLTVGTAQAHSKTYNTFITEINSDSRSGVKFDAPHLVSLRQINKDLFLGVEGGKDIISGIFEPSTRSYIESDRGYFGYIKATYEGCLVNCGS